MKLLNMETLVTGNAIREISLNTQDFTSVRLAMLDVLEVPTYTRWGYMYNTFTWWIGMGETIIFFETVPTIPVPEI
jgi:hypothetical protein